MALLLISAGLALSIAWTPKKAGSRSRTVSSIAEYNKVSVSENLTVVFKNMPGTDALIEGHAVLVDAVDLNVANGTLFVTAKKESARYAGTIYLPAKNLVEINVKANAKVYSEGFMKCDNLTVYIAEGSHAELKTQGKLEIKPSEGTQLDFEKYSVTRRIVLSKL